MSRTYYAIEHRYGSTTGDEDGDHIGTVYAFRTAAARANWLADSHDYVSNAGHRAALKNASNVDRRAIRWAIAEGSVEEAA